MNPLILSAARSWMGKLLVDLRQLESHAACWRSAGKPIRAKRYEDMAEKLREKVEALRAALEGEG